jgi:hypothetical protein
LHQAPVQICDCHCADCRRASGAPFVTWGSVRRHALEPLSGDVRTIPHAGRLRSFAACCGTTLFFEDHEGCEWLDVAISSFDQPHAYRPEAAIWIEDRLPRVAIDPDRATHEQGRASLA